MHFVKLFLSSWPAEKNWNEKRDIQAGEFCFFFLLKDLKHASFLEPFMASSSDQNVNNDVF